MKLTAFFAHREDLKTMVAFTGDARDAKAVHEKLYQAGLLFKRNNCTVIKHPVTGLECAMSPGDVVIFDSETFKFTVIQMNNEALRWGEITFDCPRPVSGSTIARHSIDCSTGKLGVAQLCTLDASVDSMVQIRIVDIHNTEGEIVFTGTIPFTINEFQRADLPPAFTYRGHELSIFRTGTQFIIGHSGESAECIQKQIICEIIAK